MNVEQRADNGAAPPARRGGLRGVASLAQAFVRAHVIALSMIVALLLIYALVGFFAVPRLARTQIEDYVTQTLHRKVTLGEVRFNPFVLDASIAGLELTESDGAPLVSFRHLYVNAQLASIWQRAVVLKEVELSAPDVQVVIARNGTVNLAQLVPESAEPEPQEKAAPPHVRIGRLAITQGRVGLEDRTRARPFTAAVTPIRFTLTDFKTDFGYRNKYRFAGTTTAGEQLEWSGGFTVQPLGSSGDFSIQRLKLATIDAYLYESLPFKLAAGEALMKGTYDFKLDPFALDVVLPLVAVRNLALAERASGATKPVEVPEIDVQQVLFSMARREVGLKRLDVRGARVDVALEKDGSISLSRLFAPTDSSPPAAEETPQRKGDSGATGSDASKTSQQQSPAESSSAKSSAKSSDWNVHVDTIAVEDARVMAEDRSVSPVARFELTPIRATIDGWRTDPGAKLQVDADVTINQKGRLKTQGELRLEPLDTDLAIDLTGFDLPAIQPYLAQMTALTLHSGKLDVKGKLAYGGEPESAPPLAFTGEVQVADLRTTDQILREDFVKWRNLTVSGVRFQRNPDRLSIDRIVARQPYAKVTIEKDTSLNVTHVLSPRAEAGAPTPALPRDAGEGARASPPPPAGEGQGGGASAAAPFPVHIRTVQLIDGSANFADYSIEPSFATGILELNGKVAGLSSDPASRAQVTLKGKVDKYAPVDITGEANILAATKYTMLAMNFRNMELTTFNPYSGKFAGYNISRGKLSTELKYKVEDRKLLAEHHIVIDNLEFGEKTDSKDAAPIPVKLAVALLKDRNGVIDVNLPVSGSLDDPKFRLGPIIWKAFLGLLTKIVTAPFAALGALFGGGEELAYVDFAPGAADLAGSESEKLAKLAKALVERPQLKLNVPLTVVSNEDGDALAQKALAAQLPEDTPDAPADDAAKRKRLKALESLYKTATKSAPEYPPDTKTDEGPNLDAQLAYLQRELVTQLKPDASALDALSRQRARSVQDALLANTELSAERVFITSEQSSGKVAGGHIRMEMKLE